MADKQMQKEDRLEKKEIKAQLSEQQFKERTDFTVFMFFGVTLGIALYTSLAINKEVYTSLWSYVALAGGVAAAEIFRIAYKSFENNTWKITELMISAAAFLLVGFLTGQMGIFSNVLLMFGLGGTLNLLVRQWLEEKKIKNLLGVLGYLVLGFIFAHELENLFDGKAVWGCSVLLVGVYFLTSFKRKKR